MVWRKVRILYFMREKFPTHRVDVDVLFGREMLRRGHAIDFVMQASSDGADIGPVSWRNATVWVGATDDGEGMRHRIHRQWLAFWHDVRSLRIARADRYDAIQVRNKVAIALLALLVARARGLQFYYWLSFPFPESQLHSARTGTAKFPFVNRIRGKVFSILLYRWILPRCDHIFVQSQRMKEDICALGLRVNAESLTPVPMGVQLDCFPDIIKLHQVTPTTVNVEIVIGYLGTLIGQRSLGILVEMLALLRGKAIPAKLLLVGDGEQPKDRRLLQDLAEKLAVSEYVEITGFLPREEALARMAYVDIAVSPFLPIPIYQSTSPTKLVEYLALALPVVANRHPEQRLVLRESGAGVCVPWGARYFARAIVWLIHQGAEKRKSMGRAGYEWVAKNRDYARIADELERKYLELPTR